MEKQFQNWILFFIAGIIAMISGLIAAIVLMKGSSVPDVLFGYILFGLVPLLLVIIIDRILVWKFGNKNVNKVQFSILVLIVFLWIVRFVLDLFI
ncbi:hypothetical protein CLU97_1044 [Chryseobacterium sp. 7]|uniref:hypothetical protein n=1 Tax=Chryseobacterium sp. 7 TaxID=2035214 RepID=UPI000EB495AF|nr:hypothetical protein [Chryseobacterium sp. 7]RLJ31608.1 hypothetical protein CLU97_1044 [Chryseobacterium sp. 7]